MHPLTSLYLALSLLEYGPDVQNIFSEGTVTLLKHSVSRMFSVGFCDELVCMLPTLLFHGLDASQRDDSFIHCQLVFWDWCKMISTGSLHIPLVVNYSRKTDFANVNCNRELHPKTITFRCFANLSQVVAKFAIFA